MKKVWKRIIVAFYLMKMNRAGKVKQGKAVHDAVDESAFFPPVEKAPLLTALDTANTDLSDADAATEGKSSLSFQEAYTAELQWDLAYRNVGYYVQTKADQLPGQAMEIITAADMKFKKSSVKMQPPRPVLGFQARVTGNGDTIKLLIDSDNPRSTHFEIIMTATPVQEDSWVSIADITKRKFIAEHLVNGTRYYFKVRAINNIGKSIYSDVISQIAA
ncbi:MAG: fibronectin type III domain-containing protein [Bacteroidia bacterium]